jgi:hypothetical protein
MRETQPAHKDQIEIVKQVNVKKGVKLQSRILPGDGHNCFEFNIESNELRKAEIKREAIIDINKKTSTVNKVMMKDGCIYITALNAKNAVKKLMKTLNIQFVKVISE